MSDEQRAKLLFEYIDRLREKYPSAPSSTVRARAEEMVAKKLGPETKPEKPPSLASAPSVVPSQESRFKGPPHNCRECGGPLRKGRSATNTTSGCLCIIIGIALTPVLVGILLILLGLHLGSKADGYFECRKCHQRYPRRIRWYELG
ncbi:hypothetical protein OAF82_00525 [bacterium]|nr:hypothetical protein [bacterium]